VLTFRYGGRKGRKYKLNFRDDLVAVRTYSRAVVCTRRPFESSALDAKAREVLKGFDLLARFPDAGVEVLRAPSGRGAKKRSDVARSVLKSQKDVRFAGRVLANPDSGALFLYTENLFIKFRDELSTSAARKVLQQYRLKLKNTVEYARNTFFVQAPDNIGTNVFALSDQLLDEPGVELCHPELVRQSRGRAAFPQQWHLRRTTIKGTVINEHANVQAAWQLSEGANTVIAIIDDGIDIDHEEFRSPGKIVAPRNASARTGNPRPGNDDDHGTACAGVACADGKFAASGVAPRAKLMPIRLTSGLGSQREAEAFVWAADHGADVISCSWGPPDGDWEDPDDRLHDHVEPLPDSTRLAIDYATNSGRNGRGCVVIFAAGNGNESSDNDGYASYDRVVAVAACNDRGRRSAYSDYGNSVWCSFPSNHGRRSLTPGIWTTDRTGAVGYNAGSTDAGDAAGDYTNDFGGTSSAAPGVAGVAALVLARNPDLRWDEVRDILKRSCDRIDTTNGRYSAEGRSRFYGYGRVNAAKAVVLARPPKVSPVAIRSAVQDVPIKDLRTSRLSVPVADAKPLKSLKVGVDIEHTFIGDLVIKLKPPASLGVAPITLHNRSGASTGQLKRTFDAAVIPALAGFAGRVPAGTWTLEVRDAANRDTGVIRSFALELEL
jgi:subtilisin family serine protease